MIEATRLAILSAAILAAAAFGALFGVLIARLMWADDLRHAQEIRKIHEKTIEHQKNHIAILERRLK